MLRIRFSRTGKKSQPSYSVVLAERRRAVKGRFIEKLGYYMPARKPKVTSLNKDRIIYWISKGAIPTDTAASLFKKEGFENMDRFLEPRNKKRVKKGEETSKPVAATAPVAVPTPALTPATPA